MTQWFFPSRGFGGTEGYSDPALEMFKGDPIRALAREVCQNSLDAVRDTDSPVRLEFEKIFTNTNKFPGLIALKDILEKCKLFWHELDDPKTTNFIEKGIKEISDKNLFVLRISDYNTTGLKGAFSPESQTPWKSLVKGNAFSIKTSKSSAGSFGIGKAAPFVVSKVQTVFYRTYDETGVRAAQGVTHLVSFRDPGMSSPGEDDIRRATGYYSQGKENSPFESIKELDDLNWRDEFGTDLFIPIFNFGESKDDWKKEIIIELLDNFLFSIYSGKLEVQIDNFLLNKESLTTYIDKYYPKTKHAAAFYEVIREDNCDVIEETSPLLNTGNLRLRLLYKPDMNKQVLVVRNSGMKIAKIKGLPKSMSYSGFLEIQGEELNKLFRGMENPQHNAWEPNRYEESPSLAKRYKEKLEEWVKDKITKKLQDISGSEQDIDLSEYFSGQGNNTNSNEDKDNNKKENILDSTKNVCVIQEEVKPKKIKVKDNSNGSGNGSNKVRGTIDDKGDLIGHRHRSGTRSGASPSGRNGFTADGGIDSIYSSQKEVLVSARIISKGNGVNRLIFKAEDNISNGEIEIVTMGENGKTLPLIVDSVQGITTLTEIKDGHICIHDIKADVKYILEFTIHSNKAYAMGVRAYENRK